MIAGKIFFQNEECIFHFEAFQLKIFKNQDIRSFLSPNPELDVENLTGTTFDNKYPIIHFHIYNLYQRTLNIFTFNVKSYLLLFEDNIGFDKLTFTSDELNWFYNIRKGINTEPNIENGEVRILLKSFSDVTSELSTRIEDNDIKICFGISKQIDYASNTPLLLNSTLSLIFSKTQNVEKVSIYYYLIRSFIWFVTYRKNIDVCQCNLLKKATHGKYEVVGSFHLNVDKDDYSETMITRQNRLITYSLLDNKIVNLLKLLYDQKLYLQHIPYNSRDMNTITPSRFVMITAAFEWTFNEMYGENYKTNETIECIKGQILNFIGSLKDKYTGDLRKSVKRFYSYVNKSGVSLADKIRFALDKHNKEISVFVDHIYKLNKIEKPKIMEIAERIQTQRNNYAHGNIGREIDPDVMLDLMVLEWLIYVMILNNINLNVNDIKHCINKLFDRRIMLKSL